MKPTKDEENKLGELAGNPAIEGLVWHEGKPVGYTSKIPVPTNVRPQKQKDQSQPHSFKEGKYLLKEQPEITES